MAKSYYERLAYADVDPQRVGNEAHYLSQNPNAEKYAAALDRADPAKVEETLAKVRGKFNETVSKAGTAPGQWAKSESWGLWDIGKQLHLNEEAQATNGGKSANPNYRLANPLTDPQLQDEMAARMVGFDANSSRGGSQMSSHEFTSLGKQYMEEHGVAHSITEGPASGTPAPAQTPGFGRTAIADLKNPDTGKIGGQGFTRAGVHGLIDHATGVEDYAKGRSLKETLDALKSDPENLAKVEDFLERTPIETTELPDGSIRLDDGHHRGFLADQIGKKDLPSVPKGSSVSSKTPVAEPSPKPATTPASAKIPEAGVEVSNNDLMHQEKARSWVNDVQSSAKEAEGSTSLGIVPDRVKRSLSAMGYDVPKPEMPAVPQADGTVAPAYHSQKQVAKMYEDARHLSGRDFTAEAAAGAKIPQAGDAPAQAAQKLASTESVPTASANSSGTTAAPAKSPREMAEELRAKATESRQATSGASKPATPKPSGPSLTPAEMAENERKAAEKAYQKLANSDNPAHRAMAEKAKARMEGGRVIRDGVDVGTAAQQPGAKLPGATDSVPQAAQKVAATETVPAATPAVSATAVPPSPPSPAPTAAAPSVAAESSAARSTPSAGGGKGANPSIYSGTGGASPGGGNGTLARREASLARRPGVAGGEAAGALAHGSTRTARSAGASGVEGVASQAARSGGEEVAGSAAGTLARRTNASPGAMVMRNPRTVGAAAAAATGGGGGAAAGAAAAAGRATRGSRTNGFLRGMAYNSSWIDRELDLTTRGFVANIGSIANDLGLNRRVSAYGADGTPSSYIDTFFGTTIRGGTGYAHPLMDEAGRVTWKTASDVGAATAGWAKHIEDSFQSSTGLMKHLTGARRSIFNALGGSEGSINRMMTRLGGAGTLVAPVLLGVTAISDFREGYKRGGVFGGVASAGKGIVSFWVMNKVIAAALLNPVTTLVAGGAIAAAAYATYKIFDVRNQGNNYLRQRQMQGPSWKTGPSAGMNSAIGNTIRQRSISAMENSRFNAMRSMGNESYMINAPKSRYANSTSINSTAPMLSY